MLKHIEVATFSSPYHYHRVSGLQPQQMLFGAQAEPGHWRVSVSSQCGQSTPPTPMACMGDSNESHPILSMTHNINLFEHLKQTNINWEAVTNIRLVFSITAEYTELVITLYPQPEVNKLCEVIVASPSGSWTERVHRLTFHHLQYWWSPPRCHWKWCWLLH